MALHQKVQCKGDRKRPLEEAVAVPNREEEQKRRKETAHVTKEFTKALREIIREEKQRKDCQEGRFTG